VQIKHLYMIYLRRNFHTASDMVLYMTSNERFALVLRVQVINLAYCRILVEKKIIILLSLFTEPENPLTYSRHLITRTYLKPAKTRQYL